MLSMLCSGTCCMVSCSGTTGLLAALPIASASEPMLRKRSLTALGWELSAVPYFHRGTFWAEPFHAIPNGPISS